jgi:hypothetical protein
MIFQPPSNNHRGLNLNLLFSENPRESDAANTEIHCQKLLHKPSSVDKPLQFRILQNHAMQNVVPFAGNVNSFAGLIEGVSYNASNPFMLGVVNQFGSAANAQADGGWNYGVFALNLTTQSGGRIQDQLHFRQPPRRRVPDGGASALLLVAALGGLAALSRRVR